jgi:hypothetical protein
MKQFGEELSKQLSTVGGNILLLQEIELINFHPQFSSKDHVCNGLTILLHDTEQTKI